MSISDRLDETTEQAARVIGSVMSRWDMDGRPDVDGGIDTLIARTLADAGLLAPSPNPAPWWRVVGPDGGVWCETSSESEARQKSRPGDALQRLWETPPVNQWRTEREES